jgi:hypothetical protein
MLNECLLMRWVDGVIDGCIGDTDSLQISHVRRDG